MDTRAVTSVGRDINTAASRIENDVEALKRMVGRVEVIMERTIRHARALGYYQPQPEDAKIAPTPVITTLADALQALDRAIDNASGALNVYD